MTAQDKLMMHVNALLKERGQEALQLARQAIRQENSGFKPLDEALNYFMDGVWFDFLHPGLLSLTSEAVGGKSKETIEVGAAIVLLAGGADVHDDIIDQSVTKGGKPTVFGKYGKDVAILAGDALLFKGLYLLHDAVRTLPDSKRLPILESVRQAFLGISSAEAKEASCRGKIEMSGQDYLEIIKMKVAVAEATTKIGAILGGGNAAEVEILSRYGRTFGILNTVRDEYIDVFEVDELKNRAEKECLPLPILTTFQNSEKKKAILELLKLPATEETVEKILDLTMDSEETHKLTQEMKSLMEQELKQVSPIKNCQAELQILLRAATEEL